MYTSKVCIYRQRICRTYRWWLLLLYNFKIEESETSKYINNTPAVKVESTQEENYSTPLQTTKENSSTLSIEDINWKETGINSVEMSISVNTCYSKETPYDNSKDVNKYLKDDVVKVTATTNTGYYKILGGTYIKRLFEMIWMI